MADNGHPAGYPETRKWIAEEQCYIAAWAVLRCRPNMAIIVAVDGTCVMNEGWFWPETLAKGITSLFPL